MIIVKLMGGLGNQMFQYAFGRALSIKYNTELKLDLTFLLDRTPRTGFVFRNYDLPIFNIKSQPCNKSEVKYFNNLSGRLIRALYRFAPVQYRRYYVENGFRFNEASTNISDNTYIEGYWQSYKYFQHIEKIIREDFTFKNLLPIDFRDMSEKILNTNSVCLNVRRSDFLTNDHHSVCSIDYFNLGISILSKQNPGMNIFVFSDDVDWCKENLNFDFPTIIVGHEFAGNKFESYLHLMTLCKHFLIPNSSFGWWAAWLSKSEGKKVICPKKWFEAENIDTSDLIPSDWTRI